eukprot:6476846-Amphidinium_carterae.1
MAVAELTSAQLLACCQVVGDDLLVTNPKRIAKAQESLARLDCCHTKLALPSEQMDSFEFH